MAAVNWSGFPNGQVPASKMVSVEGFLFEPVTAACVHAFITAARAAGYDVHITQGYRALGKPTDPWNTEPVTQWSAWNAMKQGRPLPGASTVASAAPPGESTHGDGESADYTITGWHPETPFSAWAAAHASLYGIVFDIPSESWHGHRKYAPQISLAGLAAVLASDAPANHKKALVQEDMSQIIAKGAAAAPTYIIDLETQQRTWVSAAAAGIVAAYVAAGGVVAVIAQDAFDKIPKKPGSIDWDNHTVGADGK